MTSSVFETLNICNVEHDNELNLRLSSRNEPSQPLQPQFSFRPVSTKYALLPIVDKVVHSKVPLDKYPIYQPGQVFNPGNDVAPWSGFAINVDVESTLRSQVMALQRNEQSVYIPSSDSDMYVNEVSGRQEQQPFPSLFQQAPFHSFNPNTCNVGKDIFHNSTREQRLNVCNQR